MQHMITMMVSTMSISCCLYRFTLPDGPSFEFYRFVVCLLLIEIEIIQLYSGEIKNSKLYIYDIQYISEKKTLVHSIDNI